MIIQHPDSCALGLSSPVCSTVLCIREIIDIIANACLQDKHLGKKTHTLTLSDASIFLNRYLNAILLETLPWLQTPEFDTARSVLASEVAPQEAW